MVIINNTFYPGVNHSHIKNAIKWANLQQKNIDTPQQLIQIADDARIEVVGETVSQVIKSWSTSYIDYREMLEEKEERELAHLFAYSQHLEVDPAGGHGIWSHV